MDKKCVRAKKCKLGLKRKTKVLGMCHTKLKITTKTNSTSANATWIVPSSASEIKIRGRTTRPTKDNANANMPKIKSKALGFRRPSNRSRTSVWNVSALKINEKTIPDASVVIPSTNSDSASTRSKGALSAKKQTNGSDNSQINFQKQYCETK